MQTTISDDDAPESPMYILPTSPTYQESTSHVVDDHVYDERSQDDTSRAYGDRSQDDTSRAYGDRSQDDTSRAYGDRSQDDTSRAYDDRRDARRNETPCGRHDDHRSHGRRSHGRRDDYSSRHHRPSTKHRTNRRQTNDALIRYLKRRDHPTSERRIAREFPDMDVRSDLRKIDNIRFFRDDRGDRMWEYESDRMTQDIVRSAVADGHTTLEEIQHACQRRFRAVQTALRSLERSKCLTRLLDGDMTSWSMS